LIEAFLISGGGAVMGILIGLAVPVAAQFFLPGNLRVPISPMSVVIAFVVSCSTGLFFGYLPANNAARLQPIESLRYDRSCIKLEVDSHASIPQSSHDPGLAAFAVASASAQQHHHRSRLR